MATRMQQRRGTAAQWTSANPILAAGEIGFETDTGKFKIGNGSSTWSSLNYYVDANSILDGAPGVLDTLNELAAAIGDDPAFITTVATNLSNHEGDTSNVHGIANTANLVTLAGEQTLTNKTLSGAVISSDSTATTQTGADSSTKIATTEFVQGRVNALINSSPDLLNTLEELSNALNDDPNFATTVTNSIATKVSKAGDTMTGPLTLSGTPTENTHAATKSYVDNASVHNAVTTNVHGITNTANLATQSYAGDLVTSHSDDTTGVHGIADTSVLVTTSILTSHNDDTSNVHGITNTADLATKDYANSAITTHNNLTTSVHGIADTTALVTTTILNSHSDDTTGVHGITNTADLVLTSDSRLSDTRTPTDDTVTTAKIVDSNVTAAKLAGDSVTTAKIEDGAVTSAKIANGTIVNADINDSAAIDWTKLGISSTVSATEIGYVDGVTSAIQTQLDAKYSSASASTDLALKANLASPALTGTPSAPTAAAGNNTTQIATTEFVTGAVADLIASAPGALNTLDELAAALGDDANFATTVTNSLAAKAPLASPTFTGTVTLPASGIVFSDGTQAKEGVPSRTTINSVSAAYNLSTGGLTLRDTLIECNSASAFTVTIPANSTTAYPVGTSIDLLQVGAGQVTIAGAAGVTVNATPGLKLRAQWSSATLFKRATDTWVVMGDLSA